MIEVRDEKALQNYIELLLERKEADDLEFKSAAGGFPGSFWDTYSAFANTDGGTIILGVIEKHGQFFLDSLSEEQIEKYRKDFWNNVNNRSTISYNLMKSDDVTVEEYHGHRFMMFYIPRACREQRPVYRTTQPYNGTFKRNFEGDYKCTEKEVQRMFADADTSCPVDSRILTNYTMDDIDVASVQQYRQLFAIAKPDHPWLSDNDFELIRKLGGYRKDRTSGKEGFTLAGLLMFGKTASIIDNECCPNFFPDYQEKLIDNPDVRWSNRVCPDGTWEANLFQFYRMVLPRLQAVLPKPFYLENNIRRDETPAHVAVREALINACIHADYSENATLVIRLYKNKMVFSNPGTMLVSRQQYYSGGDSVCRNKALQTMFMMLGTAEKAGSGVDKILKGWKEANWRSPVIETKSQPDKVELTMRMESVMDDEVKKRLVLLFGNSILNINHDCLLILNIACSDGYVTNESVRFVLNKHKVEITDILRNMCKDGLLVAEGYGRGMKYHLPSIENLGTVNVANMATSATVDTANMATSATIDTANMATSITRSTVLLAKKRLPKVQLQKLIMDVCEDWLSMEEISLAINRDQKYLRCAVIPEMLKSKQLEMLFPGVPNHPNQKYKKVLS